MAGRFSLRSSSTNRRHHVRSISLPSRSHPLAIGIEEALNKLRNIQTFSYSSPPNIQKICVSLSALEELYKNIQQLLIVPKTQQAFTHHRKDDWVEELLLEESLIYLDMCSKTRDNISFLKANVCQLQSALRRSRNGSGEHNVENDVSAYFQSCKKLRKELTKSLVTLTQREDKFSVSSLSNLQQHVVDVIMVLQEASLMIDSIFRLLLLCFSLPVVKVQSKTSRWSLVSKLVQRRTLASDGGGCNDTSSEVESVDAAANSLVLLHKVGRNGAGKMVQLACEKLQQLEISLENVEKELESLFRCLIHTRVCLLNVLSHF